MVSQKISQKNYQFIFKVLCVLILLSFKYPLKTVKKEYQPPRKIEHYYINIDTIILERTDYTLQKNNNNYYYTNNRDYEQLQIFKLKAYDSCIIYKNDTIISVFKSINNTIQNGIKVYYPNGSLRDEAVFQNTPTSHNLNYFEIFTATPNGLRKTYDENGILFSSTYYREGKDDTFNMHWNYLNGGIYSRKHKDTQIYYYENGKPESKEYYTKINGKRIFAKFEYWDNGKNKNSNYYTDEDCMKPCHLSLKYNKKGILTEKKKIVLDKRPFASEAPPFDIETATINYRNLKKILQDSISNVFKKNYYGDINSFKMKICYNYSSGTSTLLNFEAEANSEDIKYAIRNKLEKINLRNTIFDKEIHGFNQLDYFIIHFNVR